MSDVTVVKFGGSVLTGAGAYRRAAQFAGALISSGDARLVAVVSAEFGHTDALLSEAQTLADTPDPDALALLCSTGELRSVALLTVALHTAGVFAAGLNVHETGLRLSRRLPERDRIDFNMLALRAALGQYPVVVVPGFLATSGQRIVTLGRGGSDCSAVLLAAALNASRCILIKDVDGYYTADPRQDSTAELISSLSYDEALEMSDAGCPLVQRQAIVEARARGIELVVRSFESKGTHVGEKTSGAPEVLRFPGAHHGFRDQDDTRGTTGRAAHRRGRLADLPDHDLSADWPGRASWL